RDRRVGDLLGHGQADASTAGGTRTEALAETAEPHEAALERELLAGEAVGQRLEQRGEALRPQPRAATSDLGEVGLSTEAAEERGQVEVEREEPGHQRRQPRS